MPFSWGKSLPEEQETGHVMKDRSPWQQLTILIPGGRGNGGGVGRGRGRVGGSREEQRESWGK